MEDNVTTAKLTSKEKEQIIAEIQAFFQKHPLGKVTFTIRSRKEKENISVIKKYEQFGILTIEGEELALELFISYWEADMFDGYVLRYDGGYYLTTH